MNHKRMMLRGITGLLGLGVLLTLWAGQSLNSGFVLAGLGLLALLGYLADRAGQGALLPPAGLLLGLGAGLTLSDLARGTSLEPLAWLGMVGLFGMGLLAVYLIEHEHTWALAFGGLLLVVCGTWLFITAVTSGSWLIDLLLLLLASLVIGSLALRRFGSLVNHGALEMTETGSR